MLGTRDSSRKGLERRDIGAIRLGLENTIMIAVIFEPIILKMKGFMKIKEALCIVRNRGSDMR